MRERALQTVRDEKPLLLIGSPMCTAFSTWQIINDKIRYPLTVAAEKHRAGKDVEFCCQLYREQVKNGRCFLHEHPAYATSWQEAVIQRTLSETGVETATCDQCQYGCADAQGNPIKKPTMFMTNAPELAKRLRTRCVAL